MRPLIQKLPLSKNSSFLIDKFFTPDFETPWHYHSEYEITLILKGKGKRFIGNHVGDFAEGELILLGPNLPHLFRKDNPDEEGGSMVVHFQEDFLGPGFAAIPEMQKIKLLFERSKMGVRVVGKSREVCATQMNNVFKQSGMDRLIALLQLLTMLAHTDEYELLSSPEVGGQNARDSDRLNKVFDYVMTHFTENIQLDKVAEIANMSYSGFCRYFKNRTKKNFSHFVNEIRIGYACRRLMESDVSVSTVCYECGFNNLTNFNEQFKKIIKLTPHQFKIKNRQ
ncbi:AraC family transcriptional regulator [Mucilaginibacter hurinus]|uniref:AraC family transcriptional regulator n=1 Tax=Mucilaginibacter hurinus TaxID=2201324 RepID=A0A367GTI1_9SPHI|nr:AraC family transcriptional regulator [Mucilaginibacter hurinus]RCH56590.1 AraC family transcriptional regulator [Mucilaginibacter hurinus]